MSFQVPDVSAEQLKVDAASKAYRDAGLVLAAAQGKVALYNELCGGGDLPPDHAQRLHSLQQEVSNAQIEADRLYALYDEAQAYLARCIKNARERVRTPPTPARHDVVPATQAVANNQLLPKPVPPAKFTGVADEFPAWKKTAERYLRRCDGCTAVCGDIVGVVVTVSGHCGWRRVW